MARKPGFDFEIVGMDEVEKLLKGIGTITNKHISKACRAGGNIVKAAAKKEAPYKSKQMKKSIKLKAERGRKGKKVFRIGFYGDGLVKESKGGNRSFYPVSQEYGWTMENGKRVHTKPFLRPAIDNNREEIRRTILQTLYNELKKLR